MKNLRMVQYIPVDCASLWFGMARRCQSLCMQEVCPWGNLNVWLGIVSGVHVGCMRNSRRVWSLNAEVARKISNTQPHSRVHFSSVNRFPYTQLWRSCNFSIQSINILEWIIVIHERYAVSLTIDIFVYYQIVEKCAIFQSLAKKYTM